MRGGIEAEAIDRDLQLVGAHGSGRVEDLRGLWQEPRGRDDAVGADFERGFLKSACSDLHERPLGSYACGAPQVNGPIRRNFGAAFGHSWQTSRN
jgi:hypothetical protein